MQTLFFFKNMSDAEEEKLRDYVTGKLPQIEKLLLHFPPDGVFLQVKGEKFKKHSAYSVECTMKLSPQTITAREASHLITKAVDLTKDRLLMQLKKVLVERRRSHRSIKARNKMKLRTLFQV